MAEKDVVIGRTTKVGLSIGAVLSILSIAVMLGVKWSETNSRLMSIDRKLEKLESKIDKTVDRALGYDSRISVLEVLCKTLQENLSQLRRDLDSIRKP